jgi:hypothetical protein
MRRFFALQAGPLTMAKAVELATPAFEAQSLIVEAKQRAATAAKPLCDPKLSVDILDR